MQETLPPRPAPSANHVLHLAFPSSPMANQYTLNHVLSFVSFLQSLMYPEPPRTAATTPANSGSASLTSIFSPSPLPFGSPGSISGSSSFSTGSFSTHRRDHSASSSQSNRNVCARRCRVLLFSSDGYTETSILALCLLMAPKPPHYTPGHPSALSVFGNSAHGTPRLPLTDSQESVHRTDPVSIAHSHAAGGGNTTGISLPDAYLELQIARGRSFYVYPSDLDLLKRAEARLYSGTRDVPKERARDREIAARSLTTDGTGNIDSAAQSGGAFSKWKWSTWGSRTGSFSIPSAPPEDEETASQSSSSSGIASALAPMLSSSTPNASLLNVKQAGTVPRRRARASTSPMPHIWADHWAWFSDPRFDGSFPSRVLPFLYLGNL